MRLEVLVEQLTAADKAIAHSAVITAAELEPVEGCLDKATVASLTLPPVGRRADVAEVRRLSSTAEILTASGKYDEALLLAAEARALAEALGWDPLTAAAEAVEASVFAHLHRFEEAEARATAAYLRATRSSDWGTADRAAQVVTHALAVGRARYDDAELWGKLRAVAIAHAGDPLGLREARLNVESCRVRARAGKTASAIELCESALHVMQDALGARHPSLVTLKGRLGGYYRVAGDLERARRFSEEAVELAEDELGAEHPSLLTPLDSLAVVMGALGDYDAAEALTRRGLQIERSISGPDTLFAAEALEKLGMLYTLRGRHHDAIEACREALEILGRVVGPEHPQVGRLLEQLVYPLREVGELDQALDAGKRALSLLQSKYGPDDPRLAYVLTGLAVTLARLGRYKEGLEHVERAVQLDEANPSPHRVVSLFELARLLWDAPAAEGGDRRRSRAVAERAFAFATAEEDWPRRFAPYIAWLETHPPPKSRAPG